MQNNPYSNQKNSAFWSRSVSKNFDPLELIQPNKKLLKHGDKVVSAGSCFASNLIPYIEEVGLHYIRTESVPSALSNLGENLGYANFSAAYGNVYTARQLRQLYERALGIFIPREDRWVVDTKIIDPFRPGLKFPASNNQEFDLLTNSHLEATKRAFHEADVFVFTLGLTEAWESTLDEATYPACPGTISGSFDKKKYQFRNFSVTEVINDLSWFIENLRKANKKIRFILSVSPVPLVVTATDQHVLRATTFSKSVLRVAAEAVSGNFKNVDYFPAYELITGPQAPANFFEDDRRNVSKIGVDLVMHTLLASSELVSQNQPLGRHQHSSKTVEDLSMQISTADCDEVMLDNGIRGKLQ